MNKILFLILIISSISTAQNNTSLKKENLNGSVKVLLETEYNIGEKFGKIIKNETNSAVKFFYNNKGFREKRIVYGRKGDPFEIKYYEYNLKGELIQYKIHDVWADVDGPNEEINELLNTNFATYSVKYKYDKKGNIIEDNLGINYTMTSSNAGINRYTYDDNDNIIRENVCDEKGESRVFYDYKYDSNNNIIEESQSYPRGGIIQKIIYSYNSKNDLIASVAYNHKGILISKKRNEYLEYDDNNNWTKSIYYENDIPLIIVEREIQYHMN